jgi:hypothetical protein
MLRCSKFLTLLLLLPSYRSCEESAERRAKEIVDVQFRHKMIVDFEQQAKPVSLDCQLTLTLLCTIPCQSTLERDREVRRQRTKELDILRGKFFTPLLSHYKDSVSFLVRRHWKYISSSVDRLGCKGS